MDYPKLPKTIKLLGGYLIKVRLRKDNWFKANGLNNSYAAWVGGRGGGTVYIRESLPYHVKWDKLLHEMRHVYNDWEHHIQETVIDPFMIELGRQVIESVEEEE